MIKLNLLRLLLCNNKLNTIYNKNNEILKQFYIYFKYYKKIIALL